MRTPVFFKVLTVIILVAVCATQSVPFGAVSVQGSSFDILEFDKVYTFSLSLEACTAGDLSSIGISDGGISASASSSGGESVSFSVTSGENFDSAVLGKNGAVLELSVNIPNINGFLDSSGDFIGGEVILSTTGIEYHWTLEDVGIAQGENLIRLNMRTAISLSPHTDDAEDLPDFSEEEDEEKALSFCSLTVILNKLPSKEKASFILKEAAIEVPRVDIPDDKDYAAPTDIMEKSEIIIAVCLGVAVVIGIFVMSAVYVKKEQAKKRKKRRKKRVESDN